MMMTIACTGRTLKASDKAKAVKGMMPNWQRKPIAMPQGRLMWPHNLLESTVQPMENMTIPSITVSTMLNTRPSTSLKLLGGIRQLLPEQTVAKESQAGGKVTALSMFIVDSVTEENAEDRWLQIKEETESKVPLVSLRFQQTAPVSPRPISNKTSAIVATVLLSALYASAVTNQRRKSGEKG